MKRCATCGGKGDHDPACSQGHNKHIIGVMGIGEHISVDVGSLFTLDEIMAALSEAFDSPRAGVGPRSTRDTRLEAEFRRILSARTGVSTELGMPPKSKPLVHTLGGGARRKGQRRHKP